MGTVAQYEIGELLEMAGARSRGNRHDCPKCGGLRTVTHSDEAFFCHKCGWKGSSVTLAKELGVYQRIPTAEYRELCRKRELAHEAAGRLYYAVRSRRMELLESLDNLNRLEGMAHDTGPGDESSWESLAVIYRERPAIESELDFLESASVNDLVHFLKGETAHG